MERRLCATKSLLRGFIVPLALSLATNCAVVSVGGLKKRQREGGRKEDLSKPTRHRNGQATSRKKGEKESRAGYGRVNMQPKSLSARCLNSHKTHVVSPRDVVGGRVGLDVALEVDVVALLDALRVQAGAERERRRGNVCEEEKADFFLVRMYACSWSSVYDGHHM